MEREEDHWEISAGDVEPLDTFTDAAQGTPEDKERDAIELDPDSVLDEDITVSGNDVSDNEETIVLRIQKRFRRNHFSHQVQKRFRKKLHQIQKKVWK